MPENPYKSPEAEAKARGAISWKRLAPWLIAPLLFLVGLALLSVPAIYLRNEEFNSAEEFGLGVQESGMGFYLLAGNLLSGLGFVVTFFECIALLIRFAKRRWRSPAPH